MVGLGEASPGTMAKIEDQIADYIAGEVTQEVVARCALVLNPDDVDRIDPANGRSVAAAAGPCW